MLYLYLAVLGAGVFWVVRLLGPEMIKSSIRKESDEVTAVPENVNFFQVKSNEKSRLDKLETLLLEKNKNIQHLQKELKIFHVKVRESEKVKNILEEEINRLREQNRILRAELGMPVLQSK